MMILKPDGRIDLEHRAYFLRGAAHKSVVVAAAEDGQLSVLGSDLKKVQLRRLPGKILAVSPHSSERVLAWVDNGTGVLNVQNLDGSPLHEIAPPQLKEEAPNWIKQGFEDCHFDDSGEFLWLAAPCSAEEYEIQLIGTTSWSLIEKANVTDPFGGSSCSFHDTGRPGLVSLWLAAGQDGQQVYWLKGSRSGISCALEGQLTNTVPPVFSPSGKHVLVVDENNAIRKFRFLDIQQIGSSLESDDEDNPFAESLVYLNERQVLASTNDGRVFAVDSDQMKIEGEVAIEGHEPRPIGGTCSKGACSSWLCSWRFWVMFARAWWWPQPSRSRC